MEKIFKIRNGYCHIEPDKIILTVDGVITDTIENTRLPNDKFMLIAQVALTILVLIFGVFYVIIERDLFQIGLLPIIYAFVLKALIDNIFHLNVSIIERRDIKKIKVIKGFSIFTRTKIKIFYLNKNNKLKYRLLQLSDPLFGGKKETERVINILTEQKLLMNNS